MFSTPLDIKGGPSGRRKAISPLISKGVEKEWLRSAQWRKIAIGASLRSIKTLINSSGPAPKNKTRKIAGLKA